MHEKIERFPPDGSRWLNSKENEKMMTAFIIVMMFIMVCRIIYLATDILLPEAQRKSNEHVSTHKIMVAMFSNTCLVVWGLIILILHSKGL